MRIYYIQHAKFEPLGAIEHWARQRGHQLFAIRSRLGHQMPSIDDIDLLISMGGPQSVLNWQARDYLVAEVELLQRLIAHNKHILGVCLGAQLISVAMGAEGEPSAYPEIGVFPITLTPAGQASALFAGFPQEFPACHWHNDMPGLPNGAVVLASSEGCERQIIQFTPRVLGLQCHLEFNADSFCGLIQQYSHQYPSEQRFVQTENEMMGGDFQQINNYLEIVLDRFISNYAT